MMDLSYLDTMPKFSDFENWFERVNATSWKVSSKSLNYADGTIVDESEIMCDGSTLLPDFTMFQQRPEYYVGLHVEVEKDVEQLAEDYELLLAGSLLLRSYTALSDPDKGIPAARAAISWLQSTDFYSSPASTQYHESCPSGLLQHCMHSYNQLLTISNLPQFESVELGSSVYCILVHDWCKIGLYEQYMRNVKNEQTGKWEQVPSYKHNQRGVPLGHGVSSMFLASKFARLTVDEAAAIRWHMGRWNVADNELNELQLANEHYPLVQ